MIKRHTLKFPVTDLNVTRIELDLSKLNFGLYLEYYFVFDKLKQATSGSPFVDAQHVDDWYDAMEAFTAAVSSLKPSDIAKLKAPDRNSINKILADWMVFSETELMNSYSKHGFDSFPLECPIETREGTVKHVTIEVQTAETARAYDKARTQLDKDWCVLRGMTGLSDETIKQLAMPDFEQARRRCFDFLSETAAYFPVSR